MNNGFFRVEVLRLLFRQLSFPSFQWLKHYGTHFPNHFLSHNVRPHSYIKSQIKRVISVAEKTALTFYKLTKLQIYKMKVNCQLFVFLNILKI